MVSVDGQSPTRSRSPQSIGLGLCLLALDLAEIVGVFERIKAQSMDVMLSYGWDRPQLTQGQVMEAWRGEAV